MHISNLDSYLNKKSPLSKEHFCNQYYKQLASQMGHNKNSIEHFIVFGILGIFVISKLPYLNTPIYWDAAWVYFPALIQMAENGPSLLPNSIDLSLSRGHPLLFHFLGSSFIKIFGDSLSALHSFALVLSLFCILATFRLAKSVFNFEVAVVAISILCLNELFFIQSIFVLPEVFLASLSTASIAFFLSRKHLFLFLSLTILSLIKETAIVLIIALLIFEIFDARINSRKTDKKFLIALFASVIAFASTFILNKCYFDWYFFPEHTELVKFDLNYLARRIKRIFGDIFSYKQNWIYTVPILLAWLKLIFTSRANRIYRVLIFLSFLLFTIFRKFPSDVSQIKFLSLLLIFLGSIILLRSKFTNDNYSKFFKLCVLYVFGFVLFSSLNFYTNRYILSVIPLLTISSAYGLHYTFKNLPKLKYFIYLFLLLTLIGNLAIKKEEGNSYSKCYHVINCHLEISEFILKNVPSDSNVKVNFLMYHHFSNSKNGYFKNSEKNINWTMWGEYDFIVFENLLKDYTKHLEKIQQKVELEKICSCRSKNGYESGVYKKINE